VLRREVPRWRKLKRRLSEILERGSVGDTASRIFDGGIVALIVLNLLAITLQSVPKLSERYRLAFAVIETVSLLIFTVEYALRIWVAPEHLAHPHVQARKGEPVPQHRAPALTGCTRTNPWCRPAC
jgi:hypothetical protein